MTKLSIYLALLIVCIAVTTINSQVTTKSSTTRKPTTKVSTTRKPTTRSATTRKPRVKFENPNVSVCGRKKDLYSANGKYVKSICMIMSGVNYEEARRQCAVNNMNLFIIDDEEVETLFYDGIMDIFKDIRDGYLWVNGKRQTFSDKWEVYKPDGTVQGPLYGGLDFYSKKGLGYCLHYDARYTNEYRPFAWDCNAGMVFACEHHRQLENPPRLDTTVCRHKKDLYYNGKYLKSLCTIFEGLNYDNARRRCANLGMNLFAFDSAIVDQAFTDASEDILRDYAGNHFWINGRRECHSNQWNILNANGTIREPIYNGFEWVNRPGICGRTAGNCLKLSGQYGLYQGMGNNCYDGIQFICEYKYNN